MESPNISYLDAIAGDDQAFRDRFIQILKTEFPQELKEYHTNIEDKDYEATANIVHKIKHKLNICGVEDGYNFAVRYEEELRNKIDSSHFEFIEFLQVVDNFIKQL